MIDIPPALARDTPTIPTGSGLAFEPKMDGWRASLSRDAAGRVLLHTCTGRDITSRFPELATAARGGLPAGTVLDGEIVIWTAGRLDFGAVQQRGLSTPSRAAALAARLPASFAAFDVLALRGDDLRPRSYRERRAALVALLEPLGPPLQPVLVTTDPTQAMEWYERLADVGVEGLVIKSLVAPYRAGRASGWLKVRHTAAIDGEVLAAAPAARPRTARIRLTDGGEEVQADVPEPLRGQLAAALTRTPTGLQVEVRHGTGRHAAVRLTRIRVDSS